MCSNSHLGCGPLSAKLLIILASVVDVVSVDGEVLPILSWPRSFRQS